MPSFSVGSRPGARRVPPMHETAGSRASLPRAGALVECYASAMPLPIDDDLPAMTRDALIGEVKRLRAGIRAHRDSTGHDLCWHHPQLWSLLPERTDPLPTVPDWPQFMRGCIRYRASLDEQLPDAPRTDDELPE